MVRNHRSPLKDKPLRTPGQSLDEQIHETTEDLFVPLGFAAVMLLLTGFEWYRYFRPVAPSPVLYSVGAIGALLFASYRFFKTWIRLRALKLGRDGERAVGQFLDRFREKGYHVFHDIAGDGFNLDHVLIGPSGIFTIETKTHTKPFRGKSTIVFDGDRILLNGYAPDRDPVVQAKAQASWLRELLSESTGRKFDVWPMIVYPGWFVENKAPGGLSVRVLNPKMLPGFLEHEPSRLSTEEIHLASFHLSRFIRTS
jgi:Nuclease-related domain